jgi:UDP-N-acetylmuramoylalanine--D-glutamate ligase
MHVPVTSSASTSDRRLLPGGLAGADTAVERTAPEADALVRLLAGEGAKLRLATPAELDAAPRADAAFLDAWTPEVAPRVTGLRASGALVTCLADLLLTRAETPVVAVTGTAGKTTTTAFTAQLLRAGGVAVALPHPGLSGNLWPHASLLADPHRACDVVVFELTSSHLAFCSASPHVAVVTSLWPDHVELHGSYDAYVEAKMRITQAQSPDGWLVVPADGSCERFVAASPAKIARFSTEAAVEAGAFLRANDIVLRWDDREVVVRDAAPSLPVRGGPVVTVVAACAGALATGVSAEAVAAGLRQLTLPPHRVVEIGWVRGVPVVDASMAGTPAKAAAAVEPYADGSIVLVAGGAVAGAAGPVHATPEERRLLDGACELARRKAAACVVFGSAAPELERRLAPVATEADIEAGLTRALQELRDGVEAVVVAPMFPVAPAARERLAAVVAASMP